MPITPDTAFRCGYIGLCGRPNVGKSTLLNRLVGQKLSITSRKPNTTRWQVAGIKTHENYQIIYVDMPGIREKQHEHDSVTRFMQREVMQGLLTVDVIVMVLEALHWTEADQSVLALLESVSMPVYAAVNKIDRVADKSRLLPFLEELQRRREFAGIVPLSAKTGFQVDDLEQDLVKALPERPAMFPEDQLSDRNERFFLAELLREQLIRFLGDELPYRTAVTIEQMRAEEKITHVHALIWVETDGQKAIVIGRRGERLKQIASAARQSMEIFLGSRINLKVWVKVREDWTRDVRSLREFGYE
jgi:GTPase